MLGSSVGVAGDSKLQPIKIAQIFGTGMGHRKVKKNKAIGDSHEKDRPNL